MTISAIFLLDLDTVIIIVGLLKEKIGYCPQMLTFPFTTYIGIKRNDFVLICRVGRGGGLAG